MRALGSMIKALWHTSKASSDYLPVTISVMFWLMAFIQGRWIFKATIKDLFYNHWKVMKIFTQSVLFCAETVKILCSCFWIQLLLFKECVAAARRLSMFLKERAAASERYWCATTSGRKIWTTSEYIFLCWRLCGWLLLETFQCFLMNVRMLLKRYLTTASERKKCVS